MQRSIAIIWGIADVKGIRKTLTDEQAMEVLNFIEENHDAGIGINWYVIESAINHLFGE